jgi:hypothetical protein
LGVGAIGITVELTAGVMKMLVVRGSLGRLLVLALVVAAGTLGVCCLVDGDSHDEQVPSPDVCLTALSLASAPTLVIGLFVQGWVAAMPLASVPSAWATVLTPPPRSL